MEKLEIEDLVFFESSQYGYLRVDAKDNYYNRITTNYLNQQELKQLIEFLQKQIV